MAFFQKLMNHMLNQVRPIRSHARRRLGAVVARRRRRF
jgi:hypothetical protein